MFYLIRDNLEDMVNPTQCDSDENEEDSSDSDEDDKLNLLNNNLFKQLFSL